MEKFIIRVLICQQGSGGHLPDMLIHTKAFTVNYMHKLIKKKLQFSIINLC